MVLKDVILIVYLFLLIIILLTVFNNIIFKINFSLKEEVEFTVNITMFYGLIEKDYDILGKYVNIKKNSQEQRNNYFYDFKKVMEKSYINVEKLNINIGFKDASLAGVSTGCIWILVNYILGYIYNTSNIKRIIIRNPEVNSSFDKDLIEIFFSCIIKVNLVYIIIAYIGIIIRKKGGDKIVRTSN